MFHFIRNKRTLVIPGVDSHSSGAFSVTKDYYDTPYGLVLPATTLTAAVIRFLRHYKQDDPTSCDWVTADSRFFVFALLNNAGEFELVSLDPTPKGTDKVIYCLDVVHLPQATDMKWRYECISDTVRGEAVSEVIEKMTAKQAIQWLDMNSGKRFQKPIVIDLVNWVQERKAKKLDQLFLQNRAFSKKA